ncbi:GTP pyrophosphokinase [Mesorhizobium sp. CN2-181]|uniref:GTP pyrophosphokinase n=1 Tax=Mesorhizobium yinganensis TaxID=3157707 RepID=UPI0032B7E271
MVDNDIEHLSVSGRTKTFNGCKEKIKRKRYTDPATQMTDITGIRIIVYFESDVERVCEIIERSFSVDSTNSLDKNTLLQKDQVGYRSVHYVCDIGEARGALAEYAAVRGLKFEFQIRTVLQHAWAEISHDRSYKFSGKLPHQIERNLYLYAGLLEVADRGFDEISRQISAYSKAVTQSSEKGELDIEVNTLSVQGFVESWAKKNDLKLDPVYGGPESVDEVVTELEQFKVNTLDDLAQIIPKNYAKNLKETGLDAGNTILGVVRDWMLIHDPDRFLRDVSHNWRVKREDLAVMDKYFSEERVDQIFEELNLDDFDLEFMEPADDGNPVR